MNDGVAVNSDSRVLDSRATAEGVEGRRVHYELPHEGPRHQRAERVPAVDAIQRDIERIGSSVENSGGDQVLGTRPVQEVEKEVAVTDESVIELAVIANPRRDTFVGDEASTASDSFGGDIAQAGETGREDLLPLGSRCLRRPNTPLCALLIAPVDHAYAGRPTLRGDPKIVQYALVACRRHFPHRCPHCCPHCVRRNSPPAWSRLSRTQ